MVPISSRISEMKFIKHCHFQYLISTIFLFLSSSSSSSQASSSHQCQDDQKSILLQFMNEFFSYSNPKLVSWKPNTDCCSWEGIICDNATGHVIELDLSNGDLEGTIHSHSSLFKLHTLFRLDLSSNFFLTCNFSSENDEHGFGFALLSSLTHLNLSNTQFSGQVPLEMSRLTKLVSLDLSNNGWMNLQSPNLERLIQNMSSLRVLHLDRVNMTTQNSNWCDALSSSLPNLVVLSLSYCSISGPVRSSLLNLRFLTEIDLSGNPLYSEFPEFLVNMSSLISIRLGDCGLHGELPADILSLPGLQEIDVSLNHDLRGSLPEFPYYNSLRKLGVRNTGFQGKLPESIGNLGFLTDLDLYGLDLSGPIPNSIGNLRKLQKLDLSSNHFNDSIPESIGELVQLKSLVLSSNHFQGSIPSSIGNLRQLRILDLSFNHLDGSLPSSIGNLSQLQALDLSSNHLLGLIPSSIGNLRRLQTLDLSSNHLHGSIPSSIGNLRQLLTLDLSSNHLDGSLPSSIGNLRKLQTLDLWSNNFSGKIPHSTVNLVSLEKLDLSSNNFSGSVPYLTHSNNITSKFQEYPNLLPDKGLLRLTSLDFSDNCLEGTINYSLFTLPSLESLSLQMNKFQALPAQVPCQPSLVLSYIYLSDNVLQGPIPGWIAQLASLSMLDLSLNEFNGSMDMDVFSNLINLQKLYISDNHYWSITASPNSSFPLLSKFESHSCNLVGFPTFLRNASLLNDLDMSNNRIKGQIPSWIWNEFLLTLNLSLNLLTGLEEPFLNASSLMVLDLHTNQLQGSLPLMPRLAVFFSVSGNTLVGKIPSSICNASELEVLDLSNNNLIGPIPSCVGNISNSLFVINLGGNRLKGTMPQIYAASLTTLVLKGNQLEGRVPKSLYGCQKLEVLDLGNNQIHDIFPFRLENLPQLRVLVLRSNRFHGQIKQPQTKNAFPMLHYIDLSSNAFTGQLPSNYFQTWKAMMKEAGDKSGPHYLGVKLGGYYEFRSSMDVKMKGGNFQLARILDIFTSIDLSNNHFEGKIPEFVGEFKSLHVLDLSSNNLDGPIPSSMENLYQLESLALSNNKLTGEIPVGLASLTFLSFLDLAGNNLQGPIPSGGQFNTFPPKSYEGNPLLCGFPLSKKCKAGEEAKPWDEHQQVVLDYSDPRTDEFEWRAAWMGCGCGVVAGLSMGYIFFWGNRVFVQSIPMKRQHTPSISTRRQRGGVCKT